MTDPERVVKVGTIIASNYAAQASVLHGSFVAVHPEIEFVTLIVDGDDSVRNIPNVGRVMTLDELDIDAADLHAMMTMYDVLEFATALKPFLLQRMLADGVDAAMYLDPDIFVYERLDSLFDSAIEYGVCMTPHTTAPFPNDGKIITEQMLMWAGMYNLGFIAVSQAGKPIADWWASKLMRYGISDPRNALFADQRWMDWVPSLSTVHLERNPGYNVAHWNIHERPLTKSATGWLARGETLRFLHFSGYDPELPWLFSKHTSGDPRVILSESPELRELSDAYGELLREAGHPVSRRAPYSWNQLPTGVKLHAAIRRFYRDVLIGDVTGATMPPDPFANPRQFERWLHLRQFGSKVAPLTGFEYAFWAVRGDLRKVFPDPTGHDARDYLAWFAADGSASDWLDSLGLATTVASTSVPDAHSIPDALSDTAGWVVMSGDPAGTEDRRLADAALETIAAAGIPVSLVDAAPIAPGDALTPAAPIVASTVVFVVSQSQASDNGLRFPLPEGIRTVALVVCDPRLLSYPIGVALSASAQIWAPTAAIADSLTELGYENVARVVLPVAPANGGRGFVTRESIGLPATGFVFLAEPQPTPHDPGGAITTVVDAYCEAIAPESGASMVVVTDPLRTAEIEWLRTRSLSRPDVILLTAGDGDTVDALREFADSWVSVDAPGRFSLAVADVIALNTPVIVAEGSQNAEFVVPAGSDLIPAIAGSGAADPAYVVRAMRASVAFPSRGARLAATASSALAFSHSVQTAAAVLTRIITPVPTQEEPPCD